jgi:hypothetical protein
MTPEVPGNSSMLPLMGILLLAAAFLICLLARHWLHTSPRPALLAASELLTWWLFVPPLAFLAGLRRMVAGNWEGSVDTMFYSSLYWTWTVVDLYLVVWMVRLKRRDLLEFTPEWLHVLLVLIGPLIIFSLVKFVAVGTGLVHLDFNAPGVTQEVGKILNGGLLLCGAMFALGVLWKRSYLISLTVLPVAAHVVLMPMLSLSFYITG